MTGDYLTVREVAVRLGLSVRTVRRRIADGSLPTMRIGRAVRVPAPALDLPVARRGIAAAREAWVPYGVEGRDDQSADVSSWNVRHWPDTFERMLERRRRAFALLDSVRARVAPSSGSHDAVEAILDAADREWDERFEAMLPVPLEGGPR